MAPKRELPPVSATATASGTDSGCKKRYSQIRAVKKPDAVWNRYKPLLDKLWQEYGFSVEYIEKLIWIKNREDFSARQLQNQMEKWGWRKYTTKKRDKGSGTTSGLAVQLVAEEESCSTSGLAHDESSPTLIQLFDQNPFDNMDAAEQGQERPPVQNTRCVFFEEWIKTKADAFMALGDRRSAFKIYSQLCADAIHIHPFRSTPGDLLLASCFRAASNPLEELKALRLLEYFQSDSHQEPELSLQVSLLKMYVDQPCTAKGEAVLRQAVRTQLDSTAWSDMTKPFTVADLGTWRAIIQVLWFLRHDLDDTLTYDQTFLRSQPVESWVATYSLHDRNRPSSLLGCLDWVTQTVLRSHLKVPHHIPSEVIAGGNYQWVNHFYLFTSLFEIALRNKEDLSWWARSEPETSIPAVTLLSAICHLLLDESPFDQAPQPLLSRKFVDEADGTATLSPNPYLAFAAQGISQRGRDYIWVAFLAKLSDEDEASPPDLTMFDHVQKYIRTVSPGEGLDTAHENFDWDIEQPFTQEFIGDAVAPLLPPLPSNFNEHPASSTLSTVFARSKIFR